jgi:hypothetical protein
LDVKPFDPIVEIISEPSRVDKLAAVFEAQVGKGRLLVSTCQAELNNPSRIALMDGLLRYACGDAFRPRMKMSPEVLTTLLNPQKRPPAPAAIVGASTEKGADGRQWHNKPVTIEFGDKVFYRVDTSVWRQGKRVEISTTGIHRIATKPAADAPKEDIREVGIDLTPPAVVLRAAPGLE